MCLPDEQPVLITTMKKFPQLSASTEFWCCFRWLEMNSLLEINFIIHTLYVYLAFFMVLPFRSRPLHSFDTTEWYLQRFGGSNLNEFKAVLLKEQISSPQSMWKFLRVYLFSNLGELHFGSSRRKHRCCSKFLDTLLHLGALMVFLSLSKILGNYSIFMKTERWVSFA